MREIKFRLWDIQKKKWYKNSDCLLELDGSITQIDVVDVYDGVEKYEFESRKDLIIVQYTGLKDKNGQEIYEGDIVRSISLSNDHNQRGATSVLTIKYFMGNPCLCLKGYETGIPIYPFCVSSELEIIGNIYEHSELIQS